MLVGEFDQGPAEELHEVGMAAGEVEDLVDNAIVVAEVKVGVRIGEQVLGFVGVEVEHFHGDDADKVAAPVGAKFVEGLDTGKEEA